MKNFQKGQSLVELLLAIGLSAVILPALLTGFVASREGKAQHGQRTGAVALLKATVEAVRSVREKGWSNFANNGTFYPEISGSSWTLTTCSPTCPTVNGFNRQIVISDVQRGTCPGPDCGKIVTTGGTTDPSTKKAVVTVSWGNPYLSSTTSTLYLTRYLGNNAFTETTQAQFNLGTKSDTTVTNTSGGEVILGPGSYGDWCGPSLSYSLDLPKSGVANALTAIPSGGQAFAGTGDNAAGAAFANIAISNPPTPTPPDASIVATFDPTPPIKTNDVFGETDYAYLATDTNSKEVVIIDLNNIVSGKYQEIGYFDAPGSGSGNSVYVVGNTGYMTVGSTLYSFGLSSGLAGHSGSRPALDSDGVALAGTGKKVVVNGNYAYVAVDSTTTQLQIIDVTNPSSMSVVGQASVGNVAALDFDGTNDKATIPDSPSLRPPSALTVAAWIKPDVVSGVHTAVDKRVSGFSDSYVLGTYGTSARFCAAETGTNCANGGTLSTGVWQYLTGTYDGATIRTYINGVQVATLAWTNPLTYSTFPVLIGVEDQSGSLASYFNGMIDEVRIYNRVLTQAEIATHYNQGFGAKLGASASLGLVGYWNFDENAGQIINDSAGSNNGTLGASSAAASDDPAWTVNAGNQGATDVFVNQTGDRAYLVTKASTVNREFFIIDTSTKTGNRPVLGTYEASGMDPKGVTTVDNNKKAIIVGTGGEEYQVISTLTETNPVRCGGLEVNLGIRDIASVVEPDGDAYSYIVTGDVSSEFKIIKGGAGGVYITSGVFESATFPAISQTAFNRFDVSVNNLLNTNTEFQVAVKPLVGPDCTAVTFAGSDFVGPSGTPSDKFQTTTTSGTQVFNFTIPPIINPGQCFRYKTYMSTTDFFATPVFYDITVNYSQ